MARSVSTRVGVDKAGALWTSECRATLTRSLEACVSDALLQRPRTLVTLQAPATPSDRAAQKLVNLFRAGFSPVGMCAHLKPLQAQAASRAARQYRAGGMPDHLLLHHGRAHHLLRKLFLRADASVPRASPAVGAALLGDRVFNGRSLTMSGPERARALAVLKCFNHGASRPDQRRSRTACGRDTRAESCRSGVRRTDATAAHTAPS